MSTSTKSTPATMTPDEFRRAVRARGLDTQQKIADRLNVTTATVSRWLSGQRTIRGMVRLALQSIPCRPRARRATTAAK